MFFKRDKHTKRDWAVGLDFGASCVRGVIIRRGDAVPKLAAFDIRPLKAAVGQADSIAPAAAAVAQLFGGWSIPDRHAFAVINPIGTVVCQAELPRMPLSEARAALRLKHRDFTNYYLDLVEQDVTVAQPQNAQSIKMQLLVGAAPHEPVRWYRDVLLAAKVCPAAIELSALTVVNGLLVTESELCQSAAVLLLDFGAHSTAMNFLRHSRLLFTHIMYFGSHQITEHLAHKLGVELPAAEIDKQKMTAPVQELLPAAIAPLARELRWSIDFFERQHEARVSRVLACGGVAGSAKILEVIGQEAGIHIEAWNCLQHLDTTQTRGDRAQLAAATPVLAAALGAVLARSAE